MNLKIEKIEDYVIDEETGEPYNVFKSASGTPIGKIVKTIPVENPITGARVNWYTVDFDHGIGEFTISEKDEITDERLKAIAEYKRYCLREDLNDVENKHAELETRLWKIEKLLEENEAVEFERGRANVIFLEQLARQKMLQPIRRTY